MYMCKMFPNNRQKLKKRKCNLHEIILHRFRHFEVGKRRNLLRHAKPILGKLNVT